jgi:HAD superfamily hydrolase (TIGR01509 family)
MQKAGLKETLSEDLFYSLGGVPTRRVAELFGHHYKLTLDADRVTHEKELLYLKWVSQAKVIEPVASFARKMSATHPCSIATGGTPDIAFPALETTGLRPYFKVEITPLDVPVGRGKPAPDMFLLAAERMGVAPEKCLVFEDAEPGIQAAIAAGMKVVRVPSRAV